MRTRTSAILAPLLALGACTQPAAEGGPDTAPAAETAELQTVTYRVTGMT